MLSVVPLGISPLSEPHLNNTPPSQRCCLYYDIQVLLQPVRLRGIVYISYVVVQSGLKWSRCLIYHKTGCVLLCAGGLAYIAQYLWLFLCCARLFLTRGRKHEQCHAVDSFDVLGQISEANHLLYFKISAVCSLKKKMRHTKTVQTEGFNKLKTFHRMSE